MSRDRRGCWVVQSAYTAGIVAVDGGSCAEGGRDADLLRMPLGVVPSQRIAITGAGEIHGEVERQAERERVSREQSEVAARIALFPYRIWFLLLTAKAVKGGRIGSNPSVPKGESAPNQRPNKAATASYSRSQYVGAG